MLCSLCLERAVQIDLSFVNHPTNYTRSEERTKQSLHNSSLHITFRFSQILKFGLPEIIYHI